MGKIRVSVTSLAPPEKLFNLGLQVVEHPGVFPNISELRILERRDDGLVTTAEWTARIKLLSLNQQLSWIQIDQWSREDMCCRFSLSPLNKTKMKRMSGAWYFRPEPGGTRMLLDMDFAIKHPLATPAVHGMIDEVMRKNHEALLKTVGCRAEEGCESLKP